MNNGKSPLDDLADKVQNAQNGTAAQQPIEQYIEKLIDAKGYPDLNPEVRVELRSDLMNRLDDFIAARSIAALSDEKVIVFEKMLKEEKPEEEVQTFLMDNIADYQQFITNVLMEFQGVYLGTIPIPPTQDTENVAPPAPPPPAPPVMEDSNDDAEMPPPPPPAPVKN